jgi:hypothetical protein
MCVFNKGFIPKFVDEVLIFVGGGSARSMPKLRLSPGFKLTKKILFLKPRMKEKFRTVARYSIIPPNTLTLLAWYAHAGFGPNAVKPALV